MDMLDEKKLSIDMNYYCTKMYSDSDSKQQQGSYQFGLKPIPTRTSTPHGIQSQNKLRFLLRLEHKDVFGFSQQKVYMVAHNCDQNMTRTRNSKGLKLRPATRHNRCNQKTQQSLTKQCQQRLKGFIGSWVKLIYYIFFGFSGLQEKLKTAKDSKSLTDKPCFDTN